MTHMIPFEAAGLPAHIAAIQGVSGDDLTQGAGGGFPVISIKGKVFHINRGDDSQLVERPNEPGVPAPSIEVVILRANPALSKTYYKTGYTEGSDAKPDCYSEDGVKPANDAVEKQSTTCALCPHNQWGSKVSQDMASKGKACGDVRRLAVAPVGQVNDPMLLRVPAASLKPLAEYGKMLKQRGVAYPSVSTRISFDFSVSHPALTFAPVAFISEDMAAEVQKQINSDQVIKILGLATNAAPQAPQAAAALPAPVPAPQVVAPPPAPVAAAPVQKAAPKAAAKKAAPTQSSAFSSGATPPPPPAPKPAVQPQVAKPLVEVNIDDELGAILSQAGFDDVAA